MTDRLPPCFGHDGPEGVFAFDLDLYIRYFIKKEWFTLHELNSRIENFQYSKEDKNDKPCKLGSKRKKIPGAACQVWNFLRLFPLMVHDKIKEYDDEVWHLVLLLNEITEIISAPEIHESYLPYLQAIINEYLCLRKLHFPGIKLRPKHHYLQHYPDLIRKFGPLLKVWSLRFESKHSYFKRVIRNLHNFINITKALSTKHELLMSYLRLGADFRAEVKFEGTCQFQRQIYSEQLKEAVRSSCLSNFIQESNSIIIKGTTYKKGSVLILNQTSYRFQVKMGQICLFLHDDHENIYIVFEILKVKFQATLGCYEIGEVIGYECLTINKHFKYEPSNIYTIGNLICVKPKYGFITNSL